MQISSKNSIIMLLESKVCICSLKGLKLTTIPIHCENTFIDKKIQFQILDVLLLQNLRKQRQIR